MQICLLQRSTPITRRLEFQEKKTNEQDLTEEEKEEDGEALTST